MRKGRSWNEERYQDGKDGRRGEERENPWQKGTGKKGSKGQEKVGKGATRAGWTCGKTGRVAARCRKGGNYNLCATDENDSENVEEATDNDEELQVWCLLEESENEQWQEVVSRRDKQKVKNANQAPPLSVENSHNSNPKNIIEEKDRWAKVRVTIDSAAVGHVMLDGMFPRVRLERKTSPKRFGAENGEQVRDLGEKDYSIQDKRWNSKMHNTQKCECCQTLISMQKVVPAGNVVVLDEKNPRIRNVRNDTMIKLNGVYTMDMWIWLDETGPVFQLLLCADAFIAPALFAGLSDVDELMVALSCRVA